MIDLSRLKLKNNRVCIFLFILVYCNRKIFAQNIPFNNIYPSRTLVVLSAPSIWDETYRVIFQDIVNFQINFAKIIHENENSIILVDKHTLPYYNGRSRIFQNRLPFDALLEANIYDINLHDFAPFGIFATTKFVYRDDELADITTMQIDDSMNRFLKENDIKIDRQEPNIILSAKNVVHNGKNMALISETVLDENNGRLPEWALLIKLFNVFKKVYKIPHPYANSSLRFDDVIAFIDEKILVTPVLIPEAREKLENTLDKRYHKKLTIIELPSERKLHEEGNCGIYSALLTTDKYIYVPVFGNDPGNWQHGYSSMTDKIVLHTIQSNTRKKITDVDNKRING
uniref:Uncharacterized protein n=1 Tax=Acrobeloides nanus TaxID=290746 RepID=A0A914C6D6_9BILA